MSLLKKLGSWFFLTRRSTKPDDHPDLNPLDLDDLKKELNLAEEARRLGEVGLPSPEATKLSAPEMAIVSRLESTRRNYQTWALVKLNGIHDRLTTFDITKVVNRALQHGDEYERLANTEISNAEAELRKRGTLTVLHQDQLIQFRTQHGLSRSAEINTGLRRTIFLLFAIIVVVVEGVANSFFFAQGLDGGLIEGFLFAFFLAIINFSVAFFLGKLGVPYINHNRPALRFIGYTSLILAFVLMVVIGLMIAHFRDSLGALQDTQQSVAYLALEAIKANPFGLLDIMSWLLFFISIFFALVGLYEGYKWGDPYPGYERKQRNAEKATNSYNELVATLRGELAELKEGSISGLERDVEKAKGWVVEFRSQVQQKGDARLRLDYALNKAENMLVALLTYFRNENELHRKQTEFSKPAYFDTTPILQDIEFPSFDITREALALIQQETLLNELLGKLEAIRAQIQSAYDTKFDQVKPVHRQV